jgi:spermidine/putrescine transport system ATP-binding protein
MKGVGTQIILENIWKRYEDLFVLKNINIEIESGEFFVVLGPSGSGKTTLLKIIAGLEEPTRGIIMIDGKIMNKIPPQKRNLGVLFQRPALFPHLNVYENIAFGLRVRGWSENDIRKRVYEMLELVRLDPSIYSFKSPEKLSGGEQQRVALARALAPDPLAILLDEPLSHLDYHLRKQMINELKRLQKDLKKTFFYITHDQWEALALADRIAILFRGEVQQIGSPKEIYERPKNIFVASFIGDNNIFEAQSIDGKIYIPSLNIYLNNVSNEKIKIRDKEKIYVAIRPEKIKIIECSEKKLVGKIIDISYLGSYVNIRTLVNNTEILVRTDLNTLSIGEEICLDIFDEDIATLEE